VTPISLKEASRILRRQPGARLVLKAAQYWVVPGGRVAADVAWRLIQRLEIADNGLLGNCPQSWRYPGNRHAPDRQVWAKTLKEIRAMNIREFLGPPKFIKHGDHQDGPRRTIIESVAPNKKYEGKLDATLEYVDGGRGVLSLNVTNLTALSKAWGMDTDAWLSKEVELSDDQVPFGNGYVDSVVVRPISPPIPKEKRTAAQAAAKPAKSSSSKPAPRSSGPIDDEVPFNPERR
jgi:hypothetical protein